MAKAWLCKSLIIGSTPITTSTQTILSRIASQGAIFLFILTIKHSYVKMILEEYEVDYMFDDRLRFFGYREFYNKREFVSKLFNYSSIKEKQIYKYYIYSRRYLKERTCDIIWEYLNAFDNEEKLIKDEQLYKELFRYKA